MLRRPFVGSKTVMIANPKGGAGKTPTTFLLGATLGSVRGGYVVAWDNNETRGTLGMRARPSAGPGMAEATVGGLLSSLDRFEKAPAGVAELAQFVRPQEASFDVLASAEGSAQMAQIGEKEFARLHRVLTRFYRIVLVDTGNNVRAPNWQAACRAADLLVVVSNYEWDTGYSASWMLDHLRATGHEDLASGAVTVLTAADDRTDKGIRAELIQHFSRTAAIVEIPHDPALRGGGQINFGALRENTRRAWVDVADAVCTQLAITDSAVHQAPDGSSARREPGARTAPSPRKRAAPVVVVDLDKDR